MLEFIADQRARRDVTAPPAPCDRWAIGADHRRHGATRRGDRRGDESRRSCACDDADDARVAGSSRDDRAHPSSTAERRRLHPLRSSSTPTCMSARGETTCDARIAHGVTLVTVGAPRRGRLAPRSRPRRPQAAQRPQPPRHAGDRRRASARRRAGERRRTSSCEERNARRPGRAQDDGVRMTFGRDSGAGSTACVVVEDTLRDLVADLLKESAAHRHRRDARQLPRREVKRQRRDVLNRRRRLAEVARLAEACVRTGGIDGGHAGCGDDIRRRRGFGTSAGSGTSSFPLRPLGRWRRFGRWGAWRRGDRPREGRCRGGGALDPRGGGGGRDARSGGCFATTGGGPR